MTDAEREEYEERAAIMQHHGGLTREEAEAEARRLVMTKLRKSSEAS